MHTNYLFFFVKYVFIYYKPSKLFAFFFFFLDIYPFDDRPSRCVFMSEILEKLDGQNWWEMSNLEQVKTMWNRL